MCEVFLPDLQLKRDLFGRLERGAWLGRDAAPSGVVAVRRDVRGVPWWTRALAELALHREARVLDRLAEIDGVPRLLARGRGFLIRSWIDGEVLSQVPALAPEWFVAARQLVAQLHAAGVTHNDLHKEANWLVRSDGGAAIVDFQLATCVLWPRWLRKLLEREDVRHLLKHKRRHCAAALTEVELRVLARPALTSRLWRATGKRLYNCVTRRLLGWSDREGRGRGLSPARTKVTAKRR